MMNLKKLLTMKQLQEERLRCLLLNQPVTGAVSAVHVSFKGVKTQSYTLLCSALLWSCTIALHLDFYSTFGKRCKTPVSGSIVSKTKQTI